MVEPVALRPIGTKGRGDPVGTGTGRVAVDAGEVPHRGKQPIGTQSANPAEGVFRDHGSKSQRMDPVFTGAR